MEGKLKRTLLCLLASVFSTSLFAESKTVVLQNGLDGYEGTRDTYMSSSFGTPSDEPKGTEATFQTFE